MSIVLRGLLVLAGLLPMVARALDVTLFINRDTTSLSGIAFPAAAFNTSPVFELKNALLEVELGEPLVVTLVNMDSVLHTFTIDGVLAASNQVAGGDTAVFPLTFTQPGCHRYYSATPRGSLLGAGGIILVGHTGMPHFFWNLFEVDAVFSAQVAAGLADTVPPDLAPDLFLINGAHAPATFQDTDTYVMLQQGDSAIIAIANGGLMEHSIHFHGFHVTILHSRLQPERVGWVKDTFPVKRGEAMAVLLVADQPGMYPVHDHNLIVVTTAGVYPGGMMTHIEVMP
jgi:FtsP/CotA-like multicopper oxidase with cupredoxin domain